MPLNRSDNARTAYFRRSSFLEIVPRLASARSSCTGRKRARRWLHFVRPSCFCSCSGVLLGAAGSVRAPAAISRIGPDAPPLSRTSPFWNIGAGLDGDLPLRPWALDLRAKRVGDNSEDNPDAHCLPIGLTQLHNHPQPRKIIQTPSLIVILYESNGGVRQIFLDGRPFPNNDPQPWWYGYSIGKWDGDTLVVETNGFRDGGWLDMNGAPLTDAARMTERIRRVNYGTLEIDVTIDDPKAYTRAWDARTIRQRLMPDDELIEFVCAENEKSSQHYK